MISIAVGRQEPAQQHHSQLRPRKLPEYSSTPSRIALNHHHTRERQVRNSNPHIRSASLRANLLLIPTHLGGLQTPEALSKDRFLLISQIGDYHLMPSLNRLAWIVRAIRRPGRQGDDHRGEPQCGAMQTGLFTPLAV
jgi:hypothetical protein